MRSTNAAVLKAHVANLLSQMCVSSGYKWPIVPVGLVSAEWPSPHNRRRRMCACMLGATRLLHL